MLGLVAAFLFAGYTLVYAAVANGGKFAATPWEGLRRSAYDEQNGQTGGAAAAGGASSHVSLGKKIIDVISGASDPTGPIRHAIGLP